VSAFPFAMNNDLPLPKEAIDNFRNSQYWSIWASELALDVVDFSVTDLAEEVAADPDYASRIFAIYQMLLVDQANSFAREKFAKQVVEHFCAALSVAGCLPAGNPLDTAINYAWVPSFAGVHPDDVNTLRPDLQQPC
jgi:hypothetical protein